MIKLSRGAHVKPVVRWSGSKRAQLSSLVASCPPAFKTYYEPFCGSACLFLAIQPNSAVLSDLNDELIGTYRTLRRSAGDVSGAISRLPKPDVGYYDVRALNPTDLSARERAARFLYLNHYCFNGIYRTNRRGTFNVPCGRKTGDPPSVHRLTEFSSRLRRVQLKCCDFEEAVATAGPGDFVYLDPPYFADRPTFGEYGYSTFRESDLDRFLDVCRSLDRRGVMVLVSYGGTADIRRRLPEFRSTPMVARRAVAACAARRIAHTDFLLANYARA